MIESANKERKARLSTGLYSSLHVPASIAIRVKLLFLEGSAGECWYLHIAIAEQLTSRLLAGEHAKVNTNLFRAHAWTQPRKLVCLPRLFPKSPFCTPCRTSAGPVADVPWRLSPSIASSTASTMPAKMPKSLRLISLAAAFLASSVDLELRYLVGAVNPACSLSYQHITLMETQRKPLV